MKTATVTTGYGYVLKDSKIIAKFELSPGEHPINDDCSIVNVANKAALDAVIVYHEPVVIDTSKDFETRLAKLEAKVGV